MSHLHPGRWARPRPLVLAALAAVAAVALPTVAGAAGGPSAAVSVAGAGQAAALRDNHVVVKLRAPAGSRVAVRAFARVGATTKPISWMRTASVGRSGSRSLTLPLSRAGRAILARCGVATPVSAAVTSGGRTLKSKWKTITADNRDCDRKPDTKVETITLPGETKTVTTPGPTVTEKLIEKVTETVTVTEPAPESPKEDLFRVGTAVKDISPTGPLYVGGYGAGYKVTGGVHDPLQVRAFFVGRGKKAVTFVSVDAQGWFAGYQSPTGGDGQDAARAEAAAALAGRGVRDDGRQHRPVRHPYPRRPDAPGHLGPDGRGVHAPGEARGRRGRQGGRGRRAGRAAVVRHRLHQGARLPGAGHRPDGGLRRRHADAGPVGAQARDRRDRRDLHHRAGPRRPVQPDRGGEQPVQRRLPGLRP